MEQAKIILPSWRDDYHPKTTVIANKPIEGVSYLVYGRKDNFNREWRDFLLENGHL